MPDIQEVIDVTFGELTEEDQKMINAAAEQFAQKCLLSFAKRKGSKPYQKSKLPRVLLPGQSDPEDIEEMKQFSSMLHRVLGETMANHNSTFLHVLVNVFGQNVMSLLSSYMDHLVAQITSTLQRPMARKLLGPLVLRMEMAN
jgi:hypothetical protein